VEFPDGRPARGSGSGAFKLSSKHHAYPQPENNSEFVYPLICNPGGRMFYVQPWMGSQAYEFLRLIQHLGDTFELCIKGPGLLAHILEMGADVRLRREGGEDAQEISIELSETGEITPEQVKYEIKRMDTKE